MTVGRQCWPISRPLHLHFITGRLHKVGVFVENPWPPVVPHMREVKGSLVNVLLDASKKNYHFKRTSSDSHAIGKSLCDSTACKDDNAALNHNMN